MTRNKLLPPLPHPNLSVSSLHLSPKRSWNGGEHFLNKQLVVCLPPANYLERFSACGCGRRGVWIGDFILFFGGVEASHQHCLWTHGREPGGGMSGVKNREAREALEFCCGPRGLFVAAAGYLAWKPQALTVQTWVIVSFGTELWRSLKRVRAGSNG